MKMEKPKKLEMIIYDYTSAANYIAQKYGYGEDHDSLRDPTGEESFWSHLVDLQYFNGSILSFGDDIDNDDPQWIQDIFKLFVIEFGHPDSMNHLEVNLYVTW